MLTKISNDFVCFAIGTMLIAVMSVFVLGFIYALYHIAYYADFLVASN